MVVFAGLLGFCATANMVAPVAHADPSDDCFLAADKGWVRIALYQEVGNGQKGNHLWTMDFPKGASQRIPHGQSGPNHRLRFDYANSPNDALHGDVGFTCINNQRIVVP
jgi:hypothetical protein